MIGILRNRVYGGTILWSFPVKDLTCFLIGTAALVKLSQDYFKPCSYFKKAEVLKNYLSFQNQQNQRICRHQNILKTSDYWLDDIVLLFWNTIIIFRWYKWGKKMSIKGNIAFVLFRLLKLVNKSSTDVEKTKPWNWSKSFDLPVIFER